MPNHHAPFPVSPAAQTIISPLADALAAVLAMQIVQMQLPDGEGGEIVCQVNADGETDNSVKLEVEEELAWSVGMSWQGW